MGVAIENIEMWLAVQHWEMYYDFESFEYEDKDINRKVSFNDEDEVREIQTEYQMYNMEEIEGKEDADKKSVKEKKAIKVVRKVEKGHYEKNRSGWPILWKRKK